MNSAQGLISSDALGGNNKTLGLARQALLAAHAPETPSRERSDIADLIRHCRQQQTGHKTDPPIRRSSSFCDAEHRRETCPELGEYRRQLCAPGGFRRDHLHTRADAEGIAADERPEAWSVNMLESIFSNAYGLYSDQDGRPNPGRHVIRLSNLGVAIAVFKGNIGANVLFMPHAFQQGGWLIGILVLPMLATLSIVCVARLVSCREEGNKSSYGDIMEKATNNLGRTAVNLCVVVLQMGTCCLYLINVGNVLRGIVFPNLSLTTLIFCEAIMISPLVLIRNVAKLSPVNASAGLLILVAICVAFCQLCQNIIENGGEPVAAVNPNGILVCIGIASFANEGIGLVLPVFDSCRKPDRFIYVYSITIAAIVTLLSSMAGLGYKAYGADTQTLVLLNFPKGFLTNSIQLAFSIVMFASFPLQLLPAIRIVEGLFLQPSRPNTWDKHIKSAFRVFGVFLVACAALLGATSLDHFVSLIGAVCGLPLAFIFPAICHRQLVATKNSISAHVDTMLVVFGLVLTIIVGVQNILTWGDGA